MITPNCSCCNCPSCTRCNAGTRPIRWVLDMSGMSNGGGLSCSCVGGVITIDCTRQHGMYLLACTSGSSACEWGLFDPSQIPSICSNNPSGSTSLSLSYFSGAFYLVFGEALYKLTTTGEDCSLPMVLTRSTDLGYSLTQCCNYPGTVTLTPG